MPDLWNGELEPLWDSLKFVSILLFLLWYLLTAHSLNTDLQDRPRTNNVFVWIETMCAMPQAAVALTRNTLNNKTLKHGSDVLRIEGLPGSAGKEAITMPWSFVKEPAVPLRLSVVRV